MIGTIPGPVFFGAIIDQTCLLLSDSCLFYDNYSMSLYMMLIVVLVKLVSAASLDDFLFLHMQLAGSLLLKNYQRLFLGSRKMVAVVV